MVTMSITFTDKQKNRKWTYDNVTDIHFGETCVDVRVEDSSGLYFFRIFMYEFTNCHIEFDVV